MQNDTLTEQQASERAAVEALHAAAKCGDVAAVKAQLAAGVDVDATDTSTWSLYGGTALTIAVENMQPEVLRVLLAGAAVNTAACLGDGGRTPLMLAATGQLQYRDGEAADAWFNNEPPITWSIETPEVLSIVQQLLDAGADVGAATSGGWTALHCAANEGLSKVCGMLLAAGAPLESFSRHEQTPLMAAVTGWLQIYKDGLTAPSDDDDADLWIGTELIDTTPQHLAVVQQLLQAGAAVDAADSKEDTALHYAADPTAKNDGQHDETYSADVIAALVAAGADVNRANKDGETPLHIAAQWGNYGAVAALLAAGADANAANSYGSTPLHYTEGDKECSLNPSGDWRSITTALRRAQKAQSSRKRKAQQLVAPRAAAAVTAAASAAAAAAEDENTEPASLEQQRQQQLGQGASGVGSVQGGRVTSILAAVKAEGAAAPTSSNRKQQQEPHQQQQPVLGRAAARLLRDALAAGQLPGLPNQQQMQYFQLADVPFRAADLVALHTQFLVADRTSRTTAGPSDNCSSSSRQTRKVQKVTQAEKHYPQLAPALLALRDTVAVLRQRGVSHIPASAVTQTPASTRLLLALRSLQDWQGRVHLAGQQEVPMLLRLLLFGGQQPGSAAAAAAAAADGDGVVEVVDLLSGSEGEEEAGEKQQQRLAEGFALTAVKQGSGGFSSARIKQEPLES